MSENNYFEEFGKPFDASDVSWRLQHVVESKMQGIAVPYLDARAIADRLDKVVGQNHWKDSYTPWHDCVMNKKQKQSQLCTISIYDDELKEWIGKTDGAEDSDIEPVKGGLSDAFKRAAVKWNIGRYLYGFDTVWVSVEPKRDSYEIKKEEKERLKNIYNQTVSKMFGTGNNQSGQKKQNGQQPTQQTSQPKGDNVIPMSPQQTNAPVYQIEGVRVNQGENGATSSIILSNEGGRYNAFLQGVDNRLSKGVKITNIQKEMRKNIYGPVAILKSYDIAA